MQPPLITVNNIQEALYCERKLYLQEVLQLQEPPSYIKAKQHILYEALLYTNRAEKGIIQTLTNQPRHEEVEDKYYDSARRSLQEALLNNREEIIALDKSLIETHKQLWQELLPYIKSRIKNTYHYMTKHHVYGKELWDAIQPKITYRVPLQSEDLGLQMVLDRIDAYKDHAVPYIYKKQQAAEEGIWQNHKYELMAAMLLLSEEGLPVKEAILGYNKGVDERTLAYDEALVERLHKILQNTITLLTTKQLPEKVANKNKCTHCMYKEQCYDDIFIQAKQQEL